MAREFFTGDNGSVRCADVSAAVEVFDPAARLAQSQVWEFVLKNGERVRLTADQAVEGRDLDHQVRVWQLGD